jgi:hypothetical protein
MTSVLLLCGKGVSAHGDQSVQPSATTAKGFVLVAHGGAGDYSQLSADQIAAKRAAMSDAMKAGYDVLSHGGTSVDAVEKTIRILEDSGAFDRADNAHAKRASGLRLRLFSSARLRTEPPPTQQAVDPGQQRALPARVRRSRACEPPQRESTKM